MKSLALPFFKALFLSTLIFTASLPALAANSVTAKTKKSQTREEPAPEDTEERKGGGETPGTFEETYEGNERGTGDFDGGGYEGEEGESGMLNELFSQETNSEALTKNLITEDRGAVLVYTVIIQKHGEAVENCATSTVTVVEKKSRKVLSEELSELCH